MDFSLAILIQRGGMICLFFCASGLLLGFPSLPRMSFPHPLTLYLSFKPQASSTLGQLPPFYVVHAKSLQSYQDSL